MSKKNRFNIGDQVLYSQSDFGRTDSDLDRGIITAVFYRRDKGKKELVYETKTTSPTARDYVYLGERCLILYTETVGEVLYNLMKAHSDLNFRDYYWNGRTNRELINEFAHTLYKELGRFFKATMDA